jgi:hypothetical protein
VAFQAHVDDTLDYEQCDSFLLHHIQGEYEDVPVVVEIYLANINHAMNAMKPPLNSHISIPVPCYAMHVSYIDSTIAADVAHNKLIIARPTCS